MEAFAAIDRKLNEYNVLGNSIRSRLKQLRDSVSSTAAAAFVSSLELARLDLAAVDADVLERRDTVLSFLARNATLFSIDLGWFTDPARRTITPRDSLIVDSVVLDARPRSRQALFYTDNKTDFDTPSVRAALLACGVKLTDDLNVAVASVDSVRTWETIPS